MIARRLVAAVLTLGALLAWLSPLGAPTAAASCRQSDETAAVQRAAVIFSGLLEADQAAKFGREREYVFRVDKVYKGAALQEQIVSTTVAAEDALQLNVQQTYLVLAGYLDGTTAGPVSRLVSDGCSGTRLLTAADPVPAVLGPGQAPTVGSSRSFTSRLEGNLWIAVGVGCLLFALIITIRHRRNLGNPGSR